MPPSLLNGSLQNTILGIVSALAIATILFVASEVRANEARIDKIETQNAIIITKLEAIEQRVDQIYQEVKDK